MNFPANEIRIRRMGATEVDEVVSLAASLKDAPHWPRAAYGAALDQASNPASMPRRIALIAVQCSSGAVLGFAIASRIGGEAELESIAVAAPWQRQGVGRQLWASMAQELRLAGVEEVRLEVRASNLPAVGLYRALGFAATGRRPRYYAEPVEDAVLMALHLG